jgi:thymidine phosphorylase
VLWLLKGDYRAPEDLKNKSLKVAGILLEMVGKARKGKGYGMAEDLLVTGKAYSKFMQIIKAQGNNHVDDDTIELGKFRHHVRSRKKGKVKQIDNRTVSRIARVAGAPKDKGAGIYLYKHVNDKVGKKDKLFTIYSNNKERLKYAIEAYNKLDGFIVE